MCTGEVSNHEMTKVFSVPLKTKVISEYRFYIVEARKLMSKIRIDGKPSAARRRVCMGFVRFSSSVLI
jgi:hypothetical protein